MEQLDLWSGEVSTQENRTISIPSFSSPSDLENFLTSLKIGDMGASLKPGHFQKQTLGPNYRGLCLFHSERTPSLYLKPRGNWFICYGCHEMGGPLDFAYKVERRFIDDISRKCGLPPEADPFNECTSFPSPAGYFTIFQQAIALERERGESFWSRGE